MTRFLSLSFLLIPCVSVGQPSALLLNRIPYTQIRDSGAGKPLLDTRSALEAVDPLPEFQIPKQLPAEFSTNPRHREFLALFEQARLHLREDRPDEAARILEEAVLHLPEEINLRVSLADSLYAAGRHADAVREYETVIERVPLHFQSLNNLGWLLATVKDPNIHDPERALDLAVRARLIHPDSHHMWSTLSQALYELGDYTAAEKAITQALQLAQKGGLGTSMIAGYLLHRDRCVLAREATSLLE